MARPSTIRDGAPRLAHLARAFAPDVLREGRLASAALLALLISTGLRVLEPWPVKWVLDLAASDGRQRTSGAGWLGNISANQLILGAAIAVVLVTSLRAWFDYLRTIGFALVSNRVMGRLRSRLYQHLQRLSLSFHDQARTGDLLVRVTGDIKMLGDVTVTALLPLVASLLMLAAMIAVMSWFNWQLTLLVLAVMPLSALATIRIGRKIHTAARCQRERESCMAANASQAISAIKVVQALSLEPVFDADFAASSKTDLREGAKTHRLSARLERSTDLVVAVATALVLWAGGHMVLRTELSVGDLWLFLTYLKRGMQPLQDFAKYAARMAKAVAAGERILDILDREPDITDLPNAAPAPALTGEVRFQDVTFCYQPNRPLFDDLDLRLAPGKRIALVGGSGSGKSTLISLLLRLYDPQAGQVTVNGCDIREFTLNSLRGQIGVVLQDAVLFSGSVAENIAFGISGATADQVVAAAELANAADFIARLPEGYATILGERGVNLSQGQRQRIAIARAAIRRAPILLLDEPTTGLDQHNERLVSEALDRLSEGRTTILATHDIRRAAEADDIVVLERGAVIERGSHAELMAQGGHYAHLAALQEFGATFSQAEHDIAIR